MQILLADPDAQFVHSVFDSWHLPESVLLPVLTERELIATIEQKSIDLAFINVQLLLIGFLNSKTGLSLDIFSSFIPSISSL